MLQQSSPTHRAITWLLSALLLMASLPAQAAVPSAPAIGTATAGDTQASVSFTTPDDGVSAITGYTVTSSPDGHTGSGAGSPLTVTGLTNGVAYTFTVTATNGDGTSLASAASNAATPKAAQTISFANPGAQNFGTTPTLSATSDSGLTPTFTSSTTGVCTITAGGALSFSSSGTCTINADEAGNGSYLAASTVSRSFTINPTVPGAPTAVSATPGNAQAAVSFSPPAYKGGAVVTGYTVTSTPGGFTAAGGGSPLTLTGLTNGTPYTFTVRATNSAGTGSASSASNSVTPAAVSPPTAAPKSVTTGYNTTATIDLSSSITGAGITAVMLSLRSGARQHKPVRHNSDLHTVNRLFRPRQFHLQSH